MGPDRAGPKPGMEQRPAPQPPPGGPQPQGMPQPGAGPQIPMSAQMQGMKMPGAPGQPPPMPGMPGQPQPGAPGMPGMPQQGMPGMPPGVVNPDQLMAILAGVGAPHGANPGSATMQQPQGMPQPQKPVGQAAPFTHAASQDTKIEPTARK